MSCSAAPGGISSAAQPGGGPSDLTLMGDWGGPHAAVSAAAAGATLEFDCARGQIDQPVQFDAQGHFDVPGAYAAEQGGPGAPIGGTGQPARYVGQVTGEELTLAVTITETAESHGPFVLTHDALPRLGQCF